VKVLQEVLGATFLTHETEIDMGAAGQQLCLNSTVTRNQSENCCTHGANFSGMSGICYILCSKTTKLKQCKLKLVPDI